MRTLVGKGFIEKDPKMRYWYVYKTPIASSPIGGFNTFSDKGVKGFVGNAWNEHAEYKRTPIEMVNYIVGG